jgi:hypothetical protein
VRHRVFGRAGAGERVGVVEVRFLVVGSAVAASGRVEARIGAVHHSEEGDSAVAVAVAVAGAGALGETKEEVGRIGLPVEARSTAAGLVVVGLSRVSRDGCGEWNTSKYHIRLSQVVLSSVSLCSCLLSMLLTRIKVPALWRWWAPVVS